MYLKKIWNLLHHPVMHYFTFFLNSGYEYVGFQKMTVMHKGYAYQFSDLIALKKLQQRTKNLDS
jgi:hypothetical protein